MKKRVLWLVIGLFGITQMTGILPKANAVQAVATAGITMLQGKRGFGIKENGNYDSSYYGGEEIRLEISFHNYGKFGPVDTYRSGRPSLFDSVYLRLFRLTPQGEEPLANPRFIVKNRADRVNPEISGRLPGKMYKDEGTLLKGILLGADGQPLPDGDYLIKLGVNAPWAISGGGSWRIHVVNQPVERIDKLNACYHRALKCYWQGTNDAADNLLAVGAAACHEMLSLCPNSPTAHNLLGSIEQKRGNYALAQESYAKVLQLFADGTGAPEDLLLSSTARDDVRNWAQSGYNACTQILKK